MLEYNTTFASAMIFCDDCGHSESFDGSFSEIVKQARKDGWSICKNSCGTWEHLCDTCDYTVDQNE